MKNFIVILVAFDLFLGVMLGICFFSKYLEKIKLYHNIKKYYINPIEVKCILIDQKEMNRNYVVRYEEFGDSYRVRYKVARPYFQGVVNGKTYTFVRTKDIQQPQCIVGENYIIFVPELDNINCRDFYPNVS